MVRWLLGVGACLLVAGLAFPRLGNREAKASCFVASNGALLRSCRDLKEAQRVAQFTRKFSDQTWVAAISEHSCSSGAGFDATVFYDSKGVVRVDRAHHFCGVEGLQSELNRVAANTLPDFYAGLQQCQLALVP
jgi:hypothetical protein